ncbi:MAG: hypothetical protein AB7O62_04945 [Pirellulales bacterium]
MASLLEIPYMPAGAQPVPAAENGVRAQVQGLLAGLYGEASSAHARSGERFAFPRLVYVTPAEADGQPGRVGTFVAAGRRVSEQGLGFFHPDPIPYREVIVSLDETMGQWRSFLMELRWCKFIRESWYESGGRLLSTVPTPDFPRDWPGSCR